MIYSWMSSTWGRRLFAGILILLAVAIVSILHDPFDFDDRPHIERLLKLALSNIQSDTAVDMQERFWEQVQFAEGRPLAAMSEREWKQMSDSFLTDNSGYIGLVVVDKSYHKRRTFGLPSAAGWMATLDFLNNPELQQLLSKAATASDRVATAPRILPDGRLAYLIAVPNIVEGEMVGFLIVASDIEKTLDAVLSEFKGLEFSVAVVDDSRELYSTGELQHRKEWGQIAKVPLTALSWQVEVWPKPEMLANTRSPFLELVAIFTTLLILLLAATIHFGRMLQAKSVDLQRAHDELEHKVEERTAELRQTNQTLQSLSQHLLHVQDEERRRIARELHDSTAQALSGVKINLSTVLNQASYNPEVSETLLRQSRTMVEEALNEIRTISYLLHPPILEDFGLESTLTWYAAGFSERSGIHTTVKIDPQLGRFSPELELILFRIVQEALGNIHRHSGSETAEVVLSRNASNVQLVVRDEGRGFSEEFVDPQRGVLPRVGVGIAGMRERVRQFGGRLEITSTSEGTLLQVVLPVDELQKIPDLEAEHSKDDF